MRIQKRETAIKVRQRQRRASARVDLTNSAARVEPIKTFVRSPTTRRDGTLRRESWFCCAVQPCVLSSGRVGPNNEQLSSLYYSTRMMIACKGKERNPRSRSIKSSALSTIVTNGCKRQRKDSQILISRTILFELRATRINFLYFVQNNPIIFVCLSEKQRISQLIENSSWRKQLILNGVININAYQFFSN